MRPTFLAGLVGAILVLSATANGAILAVGGTQFPVSAEEGPTSATLLAGGVAVPFSGLHYSGELLSAVYNNDANNPFGLDKLTFTYELSNQAGSASGVRRFTVPGFSGAQTDLSFAELVPPAGSSRITPSLADRTTADMLGFAFVSFVKGAIGPGRSGQRLVVQTDATSFGPVMASVIDGSVVTVSSFAPLTSLPTVPEPSTLVLLACSAGAIEAYIVARRFRKQRHSAEPVFNA